MSREWSKYSIGAQLCRVVPNHVRAHHSWAPCLLVAQDDMSSCDTGRHAFLCHKKTLYLTDVDERFTNADELSRPLTNFENIIVLRHASIELIMSNAASSSESVRKSRKRRRRRKIRKRSKRSSSVHVRASSAGTIRRRQHETNKTGSSNSANTRKTLQLLSNTPQ